MERSSYSTEGEPSSQSIVCLHSFFEFKPFLPPPPSQTAKLASESHAHVRTGAQIKFLYYNLGVGVNLRDHMLLILLKKFKDGRKGRPHHVTLW